MLGQVTRTLVARTSRTGVRRYNNTPAEFKIPTMDECPVPQGSWQKQYEANQKKYNMHLIAGVVALVGTLSAIIGGEILFFNALPPKPYQ